MFVFTERVNCPLGAGLKSSNTTYERQKEEIRGSFKPVLMTVESIAQHQMGHCCIPYVSSLR